MKNVILLILNGLPMAFLILFYGMHTELGLYTYCAWFLLSVINTLFLHKIWHFVGMNIYLALTSAIGLYANNLFYYSFVYFDNAAKMGAWKNDVKGMLIFVGILTVLGIGLRCVLMYVNEKRKELKDKRYRIIKLSGDALYEVVYEHFIKHIKEYTGIEKEDALFDFSIDWQKKSFVFAVKEKGSLENLNLQLLHDSIPDTAQSIHEDKIFEDYMENEIIKNT